MNRKLITNWIARNHEPVALAAGESRLLLHLEALSDLTVRAVRFHFVEGFLGERGPGALCLVGECDSIAGGKPALVEGLTRPAARRTLKVRERVPHARGVGQDSFRDGIELWKWQGGLLIEQVVHAPHDLFHKGGTVEVPKGACLGFAVCELTHPCTVRVEVQGA